MTWIPASASGRRSSEPYLKRRTRELASPAKRSFTDPLAEWAVRKIRLEGRPFSFDGHEYLRAIYDDTAPHVVLSKAARIESCGIVLASSVVKTYVQLGRLFEQNAIRMRNYQYLMGKLRQLPGIRPSVNNPNITKHSHHLQMLRYDAAQVGDDDGRVPLLACCFVCLCQRVLPPIPIPFFCSLFSASRTGRTGLGWRRALTVCNGPK